MKIRKTVAPKITQDELLERLGKKSMNASEIHAIYGRSSSHVRKMLRGLREQGLVVEDGPAERTARGALVPYYRTSTPDERAQLQRDPDSLKRIERLAVRRNHDDDGPLHAPLPKVINRRDPLVAALFGSRPSA